MPRSSSSGQSGTDTTVIQAGGVATLPRGSLPQLLHRLARPRNSEIPPRHQPPKLSSSSTLASLHFTSLLHSSRHCYFPSGRLSALTFVLSIHRGRFCLFKTISSSPLTRVVICLGSQRIFSFGRFFARSFPLESRARRQQHSFRIFARARARAAPRTSFSAASHARELLLPSWSLKPRSCCCRRGSWLFLRHSTSLRWPHS